jgi:hypothetical protein
MERSAIIDKAGEEYVFCGPLKDNAGALRIEQDSCATNREISEMEWMTEGFEDLGDLPLRIKEVNVYLTSGQKAALLGLGVTGIIMTAVYNALIWLWRNEPRIKFAQRRFLYLMLLGGAFTYTGNILVSFDPSWTCMCVLIAQCCSRLQYILLQKGLNLVLQYGLLHNVQASRRMSAHAYRSRASQLFVRKIMARQSDS